MAETYLFILRAHLGLWERMLEGEEDVSVVDELMEALHACTLAKRNYSGSYISIFFKNKFVSLL